MDLQNLKFIYKDREVLIIDNEEELALEELREKIDKILDEALAEGIIKMSRQELIHELGLSGNKID